MLATVTPATGPDLVHYLPVGTTLISAAFILVLIARAKKRQWAPHLVWWAIGVFFYGVGTALESTITLAGNTEALNRTWYWAGAILGGYPLATGSVYLLFGNRKTAHILTGITLAYVAVVSVLVFVAPLKPDILEAHRPTGRGVYAWEWFPWMTVAINLYALIFLMGGALHSSVKFFMAGDQPKRAIGTALIAFGALLPGIGGAMTKAGHVEYLYVGEFLGLVFIWIGYEFCIRAPAPKLAQEKAGDQSPASAQPA